MTASFMQTNEKFNSAMVFETQLDPNKAKEKLLPAVTKPSEDEDYAYGESEGANNFELDKVNKHECMRNIKLALDKMHNLFTKEWTENNHLPNFMQSLL